ncbi:DUF11 domain-containing protein [Streptomyces paludis]|uniref:DUF11 domain-containing protein n=1 Tax=Streptomyces paludis TaxID=2282738 RepID=UPI0013B36450|nr:DUF11 domain-containing protein [Streptomyces paludis]
MPSPGISAVPAAGAPAAPAGADLSVTSAPARTGPAATGLRTGPDDTYRYTITVHNHGPSQATDVKVTDLLPDSLVFVSGQQGCAAQGQEVTCGPLATLGVGDSYSWVITVRLADGYDGDGSDIVNEAAVTATTHDPVPDNNTASVTGLPVRPGPHGVADLKLFKRAELPPGKRFVSPGDTFAYVITVRNLGPGTARGVQVTDPLPHELRFVSSPDGCAPEGARTGQKVVCPLLDQLPAGETAVFRMVVRVPDHRALLRTGVQLDNIASVTSTTKDPDLGNNRNRPGTTGPDGGPLYLKPGHGGGTSGGTDSGGTDGGGHHSGGTSGGTDGGGTDGGGHHSGGSHSGGHNGGHHGGQLPDTGSDVPSWLIWLAASTLAAGSGLVVLARRNFSPRVSPRASKAEGPLV